MATNQKWSQKTEITSALDTTSVCVLEPGKGAGTPINKLISVQNLFKNHAIKTNPAGGQNNYAPINNPTFTGGLSVGASGQIVENPIGGLSLPEGSSIIVENTDVYLTEKIADIDSIMNIYPVASYSGEDEGKVLTLFDDGTAGFMLPVNNLNLNGSTPAVLDARQGYALNQAKAPKANPVFTGSNSTQFSVELGNENGDNIVEIRNTATSEIPFSINDYGYMNQTKNAYFTGNVFEAKNAAITGTLKLNGLDVQTASLDGTNYLIVYGSGTELENGLEFLAAYEDAKTKPRFLETVSTVEELTFYQGQTLMDSDLNQFHICNETFTGLFGSNTEKFTTITEAEAKKVSSTMIVSPGVYKFATYFMHHASGINIVSLTGNRDIILKSTTNYFGFAVYLNANYSYVKGVNTLSAALGIGPDLVRFTAENCIGGDYSFNSHYTTNTQNIIGTFIDCEAGNMSFNNTATGPSVNGGALKNCLFIRCKGQQHSFAFNGAINNSEFYNCEAGNDSFGCTDGEYSADIITSNFYNCKAGTYSFGSMATIHSANYYYCVGGANSTIAGTSGVSLYCVVDNIAI